MTQDIAAPTIPKENAPSTAGMTTKVVKGSLWTLAGQVAPMAVSLITTPFTIRLLGVDGYGVFILIALIPTYFGFADLGMSMASTKFGSEAYAAGQADREARIVHTAAVIAFFSALPAVIAIFALSSWIVVFFSVPENLRPEAALALKFAAVTFLVNFLNSIFNTPQLTRLRMDLNTLVVSGLRITGLIATPIVLLFGGGVLGAVLVLMITSLLTLAGHLYVSGRLLPHLYDISFDRRTFSLLAKFGSTIAVSGIAAVVLANAEKGIVAYTVSTAGLAYFSVASTLANMIALFSSSMAQSLIPAFSQLQQKEHLEQLSSIFRRGVRLSIISTLPMMVVLALIARPFFTVWAGPDFGRESTEPFYILLAGLGVAISSYLPYSAIIASGHVGTLAKLYWLELTPYICIVWILASRFGPSGAAAAWSIHIIFGACAQFYLARRLTGLSISPKSLLKFVPVIGLMAVPFIFVIWYEGSGSLIAFLAVISILLYALIAWNFLLDADESAWLQDRAFAGIRRIRFGG